jgi:hypothetical protein
MGLTRLAVELAQGEVDPPAPTPYKFDEGTRFVSTFGDLAGLAYSVITGEVGLTGALRWLGAALRAAFRADVHITWSLSDPLPTIAVPLWRLIRFVAQGKSPLRP